MAIAIGKRAEDVVAAYLRKNGFAIIARNVIYPFGELDLIARDKNILVFVEVKYRMSTKFAQPFEAVSIAKQRKLIKAASAFLQQFKKEPVCRFDVIAVSGHLDAPVIDHLRDAFVLEDKF